MSVDLQKPVCMFLPGQLSDLQPSGELPDVYTSAPIEPFAVRVPPIKCDPLPKPGVVAFRAFVLEHLGGLDSGICRTRGCPPSTSEHHEGRGWDWGVHVTKPADMERVDKLFEWLLKNDAENFRRAGLRYMIWDGKIWSSGRPQWIPYSGWSPHRDHVHFTFSWPGARAETSFYKWLKAGGKPGPTPPGFPPAAPVDWESIAFLMLGAAIGYTGADMVRRRSSG